jgi:hypothetical protein
MPWAGSIHYSRGCLCVPPVPPRGPVRTSRQLGAVSVVDTDSWLQVFERPNNGRTVHTVAIDASNDVAVYAEVGSPLVHVACLGETPTQLQLEGHSGPITAVAVSSTRVVSLSRAEVVVHHQVRTPDRVPAFHVLWR